MDWVDRYLRAVAKALPAEQRDDIVSELSEDIRSEIEDKENQLGRPLAESEQKALLTQRGNPLLLAARYRQDHRALVIGRQLIGPVLFPFYVRVLTFNLGLTSVVIGVIFLALQMSGHWVGFSEMLSTCLLQLFIQLSAVTLIFTLVESHLANHPDRWDLSGTGAEFSTTVNSADSASTSAQAGPRISRFESASSIIACTVALVWATEVQSHPFLILGPAAAFLQLTPICYQMFFPIVLLTVAEIVRASINLVRPDWTRFRAVYDVFSQIGGLFIAYYFIKAGSWVRASASVADRAGDYAHAVHIVNECIYYSLLAVVVLSAIQLALRVAKLFRRRGSGTGSVAISA